MRSETFVVVKVQGHSVWILRMASYPTDRCSRFFCSVGNHQL